MADVLLRTVIQNLGSFVQEELASFLGVGELTQRLSGNLTAILKSCCERLADAAHVLDDLLDECSITSKAHGDNKCITRFLPKKILAQRDVGKRMKAVAKKIDVIAKDRMKYGLQVGVTEERQRGADEWRQTTSVVTEPVVYGRYIYKEQIVKFPLKHTTDKEELSVYSIVGLGEYGKTTLAQLVYNNERHDEGFRAVIEDTIGKNPDLSSLESMRKKVQEIFKTKGASILVTARLDIVASIMATYHAHRLTRLSDSDIWSLFKQQAFRENREERAELVEIGKKLVRKCVGSTLAAKVLGSSLRFTSDEHQWISVLESEFWNLTEDDPIMSVLRLSYFNLKLSLRPCFTFCAVFPKDFEMVKENLIHLWMANGLVTSRGNLQMEDVGNEVWNELYQRSFFQEVKSDFVGNITFKMHDFIHDLGGNLHIKVLENVSNEEHARDANLIGKKDLNRLYLSWGGYANSQVSGVDAERVLDALEPHSGLKHFGAVSSIWVLEVEGVEMLPQPLKLNIINVPKLTLSSLPYVESLTASGRNEELLKSIFYNNFSEDLASSSRGIAESLNIDSCHEMESFSEQLLQGLSSLRKLSVRSCSRFKSLPDGMRHLTSLVIGDCSQFVFPQNMDSLTSLRQPEVFGDCLGAMTSVQELQIYGFSKLSSVPDNFQQLQNLQMLCIDRCPMLEKRCKRGIGEDWHKIAHIPRFVLNRELQSDVEQTKPTICENIKSAWKQFWHRPSQYPDFTYGEFDWMIEKEVDSI
ncbi:disease resistance protein RGA2 [Medicago truncatula]|uniref:disease resistance protein RGA2 n=1 Tax=Medicago truncatula TaxID=3880 RepID=UPI0019680451|nr:disease resistance protein RGA2 [Medicago truncatula]